MGAHVGRLACTDLDELLFSGQWGVTMHGRTVKSIDIKSFCSQWLERLEVIPLFRKEGGNLWCELRPMLGQACVKDGSEQLRLVKQGQWSQLQVITIKY